MTFGKVMGNGNLNRAPPPKKKKPFHSGAGSELKTYAKETSESVFMVLNDTISCISSV